MERPPICPGQRTNKALTLALAAFTGTVFYIFVSNWMEYSMFLDAKHGVPVHLNQLYELQHRGRLELGMILLTGILCGILVLLFLRRTVAIPHELGVAGLRYKPHYATVSFFIPVLCWFVPYAALQESWRAMAPEASPAEGMLGKRSKAVIAWWITCLACLYVSVDAFGLRLSNFDEILTTDLDNLAEMARSQITGSLLLCALGVSTLLMVRVVSQRSLAAWETHHGSHTLASARARNEEA